MTPPPYRIFVCILYTFLILYFNYTIFDFSLQQKSYRLITYNLYVKTITIKQKGKGFYTSRKLRGENDAERAVVVSATGAVTGEEHTIDRTTVIVTPTEEPREARVDKRNDISVP